MLLLKSASWNILSAQHHELSRYRRPPSQRVLSRAPFLRHTEGAGRRNKSRVVARSEKQYVPFGGRSPEFVASTALNRLFTFAAARIVLAQLEGSGSRGALGAYNKPGYDALIAQLEERIEDADAWVERLMRRDAGIALRLMEVRLAYAKEDFEWDSLRQLCMRDLNNGNLKIMKQCAAASLSKPLDDNERARAQPNSSSSSDSEPPSSSRGSSF